MKIKIAIDFRVSDTRQGIGMSLLALAHGLSTLNRKDQEYIFLVNENCADWLSPHLSGNCSLVSIPTPTNQPIGRVRGWMRRIPLMRRAVLGFRRLVGGLQERSRPTLRDVPMSDGLAESLGCDMIHFPSQVAYMTKLPTIYQPWDLQHRHLPQFFSREELARRNREYPLFCHQAEVVCISTDWGKADLVAQYGISPSKIERVSSGTAPEAYPLPSESEIDEVRRKFNLPPNFLIFPAVTWPHKNHENLIRGLSVMKEKYDMAPAMYFTGAPTEFELYLRELTIELGLQDSVHFLGFVSAKDIHAMFRLATAMVYPSKFEGLGLPLLEAFRAGLPIACSSATVLPEVAGDGAVFFDPDSPDEIAATVKGLLNSPELRASLVKRGHEISKLYSAPLAAEQFANLYDRIVRSAAERVT